MLNRFWTTQLNMPTLIFGGVVSLMVATMLFNQKDNKWAEKFSDEVSRNQLTFNSKLTINNHVLTSIASLFETKRSISRQEFKTFTQPLLNQNKFIQALEWIPRVKHHEVNVFTSAAKRDGFTDFQILEKVAGDMQKVRPKAEYFPVFYVEPFEFNEAAFGYDLSSSPERLKTLNLSRDLAQSRATAKISLVQETSSQFGMLIFKPLYAPNMPIDTIAGKREHLLGFALGVYRISDMIDEIMPHISTHISLSVYDNTTHPDNLIYGEPTSSAELTQHNLIDVNGRQWILIWQAKPGFIGENIYIDVILATTMIMLLFIALSIIIQKYQNSAQSYRSYLQGISNAVPSLLAYVDTDLKYQFVNHSYQRWFNKDTHSFINEHISSTLTKEGYKQLVPYFNEVLMGHKVNIECISPYADAPIEFVRITYIPDQLDNGNVIGFFVSVDDISALKSYEKELTKNKEQAEHALKIKERFFANMSHEIRTPLNGVLGMVELLEKTTLSHDQINMLSSVKSCGRGLLTILNDILDYSKIESGHISIEPVPFDITQCIEETILLFSKQAEEKNLQVTFDNQSTQSCFIGDITRIRQIVSNLLSNALKFTKSGFVHIRLNTDEISEHECAITLSVKDSGIGISEKHLSSLFAPFSQADQSITRKYGGTGLGLSISHKLAKLMDGDLTVNSQPQQGAEFTLSLSLPPTTLSQSKSTKIIKSAPKNPNKYPILLVEDNSINQLIAGKMLTLLGYQYDIANNGKEALAACKNPQKYSLILMDIQMPEMDGIEATKALLDKFQQQCPTIIAMTANAYKEDKELCLKIGMKGFITKPVLLERLTEELNKWVG